GTRAIGSNISEKSFHALENVNNGNTAAALYEQRTGTRVNGNPIIMTTLPELYEVNRAQKYQIQVGALGEAISKAGKQTAVLGNADRGWDTPIRFGPLITMDVEGITPLGDVSINTWQENPTRPYGIQTNYSYLLTKWKELKNQASLTVIDLGDLSRLQDESDMISKERATKLRYEILGEIDQFVGQLNSQLKQDELLIVMGPMVSHKSANEKSFLAPIFLKHGGRDESGIISSLTTKREGITANVDIAPSILGWLGIPIPNTMLGKSLLFYPETNAWGRFKEVLHHANTTFQQRPPVLYAYVSYQVAILIIAIAVLLKGWMVGFRWLKYMLYTIMLTPLLFLLMAPFVFPSPYIYATLLWAFAFLLSILISRLKSLPAFFVIGLISWVPMIVDGLFGGPLIKQSLMGYDPIIGARYYGIGNEYMGVVIGAITLSMSALLAWKFPTSRWMVYVTGILYIAVTVYFAAPFWGTNAGGALAASFGFAVAFLRYRHFSFSLKHLIRLFLLFLAGFGILILLNLFTSGSGETHIGRALDALLRGDFVEITNIISRKLEMNWKLIQVSAWSKVFVTALLVMGVLIIRPVGEIKKVVDRYPDKLMAGFTGIVAGALMALVVNDSGIVAAATTIIYVVIPMLVLRIDEISLERKKQKGQS
ncbi:MAG: hypothetical protein WD907_02770, partial [Bacilli bacterium]